MNNLSKYMLYEILSILNIYTLKKTRRTCKKIKCIIDSDDFWFFQNSKRF